MQRQSQNMSQIFSQDSVPAAAPVKESLGSTCSLRRSARWWIFDSTDAADSTRLSPEELAKLSKDTGGVTMRQWDWQVIALNDLQWIYLCNLCNLCNHAVICRPISSNPWLRSREFTTRWSGGAKGLPRSPSCCPASACGQEAADQGGDSFHGSLVPPSLLAPAKNAVSLFTRLKEGKNKRHSERLVGRRGTQCGTWDSTRNGWYIYIYNIYIYIIDWCTDGPMHLVELCGDVALIVLTSSFSVRQRRRRPRKWAMMKSFWPSWSFKGSMKIRHYWENHT